MTSEIPIHCPRGSEGYPKCRVGRRAVKSYYVAHRLCCGFEIIGNEHGVRLKVRMSHLGTDNRIVPARYHMWRNFEVLIQIVQRS
jgi:hypothetical protein